MTQFPIPSPSSPAAREWLTAACETCQGEGRIYRLASPSRMNVDPEIDCGECPDCHGSGFEERELFPITLDDLEQITEAQAA